MATRQSKSIGGLVLVFIALLIELFTTFSEPFTSVNSAFGSVVGWIGIGAIVLAFIGLSQLAGVNKDFAKSRLFWLIDLGISLAITIITTAATGAGNGILVGIIGIIGAVVYFIIDLLKIKTLMYGCADVADLNSNRSYANRCINAWRNYLISRIMLVAATIITFIIMLATGAGTIAALNNANAEINIDTVKASVVPLVIIMLITLAAAIYCIVALIMVLTKTIGTYSNFKNGKISSFSASTSDLLGDMKDDHKDLFGDAKDSFANIGDNFKDGISDIKDDVSNIRKGTGAKDEAEDVVDDYKDDE